MLGLDVYLGSATPPITRELSSSASQFWGSPVFCLHPLTQNDQIRHGKAYSERRVLGGQPCNCVARFVSVDWVSCFPSGAHLSPMLMGFLLEFCNGSQACKAGLMLLSDAPKLWWFVRLFRHNAGTPETDRQTEMISQILTRGDNKISMASYGRDLRY